MLGSSRNEAVATGAADTAPGGGGVNSVAETTKPETVPAKPPGGERPTDMAVG